MAIFHLSVKPVQRSKGRSATAAAAYRAAAKIADARTGELHDYTRKRGLSTPRSSRQRAGRLIVPVFGTWPKRRKEEKTARLLASTNSHCLRN